ncbi:MFS transporter [Bacillus cereus group sp. BfR-BA-01380]|uniref:MFS transporter n=1 Tax=Bacillus cereus group sp. BfR-BA-01380 TaxID=2920324 RepID=UPI001F577437|nr:MFS transporter [Bacillus cereus group sp. BfR-BA-01380]
MNRNLTLLWLAHTTSIFGTSIYALALTLMSLKLSDSVFGAGTVLFATTVPYFFLGILGGVIADRVDRKKLMVTCDLVRGIIILTLPVMEYFNYLSLEYVVIVGFFMTIFRAFFFPANQASVPLLINDKKELNKINSYMNFTNNLSLMLGPALGGMLLIFNLTPAQLLIIDAMTYFVSALCVVSIEFPNYKEGKDKFAKPSILTDAFNGIKFVTINNRDVAIMLTAFATQLLIGAGIIQLGIPKILKSINLEDVDSLFGFFISTITFSSAIVSIVFTKIKVKNHSYWIFSGYALRGIVFLLLVFAHSYWMLIVIAVLFGISYVISGTTFTTLLQLSTPNHMMGKVMALRSTIGNVADSFAYLIVGGILSLFSLKLSFIMFGIFSIFSTFLFFVLWKHSVDKKEKNEIVGESIILKG